MASRIEARLALLSHDSLLSLAVEACTRSSEVLLLADHRLSAFVPPFAVSDVLLAPDLLQQILAPHAEPGKDLAWHSVVPQVCRAWRSVFSRLLDDRLVLRGSRMRLWRGFPGDRVVSLAHHRGRTYVVLNAKDGWSSSRLACFSDPAAPPDFVVETHTPVCGLIAGGGALYTHSTSSASDAVFKLCASTGETVAGVELPLLPRVSIRNYAWDGVSGRLYVLAEGIDEDNYCVFEVDADLSMDPKCIFEIESLRWCGDIAAAAGVVYITSMRQGYPSKYELLVYTTQAQVHDGYRRKARDESRVCECEMRMHMHADRWHSPFAGI